MCRQKYVGFGWYKIWRDIKSWRYGIHSILCRRLHETLEELRERIHSKQRSEPGLRGVREFDRALEELGYEYMLVPFGHSGVMQMKIIKVRRYCEKIAQALGCTAAPMDKLLEFNGMFGDTSYR